MSTLVSPKASPPTKTLFQKLMQGTIACLLLAVSICLLAFVSTDDMVANRDFISYWAAGQQLVLGANPYAAQNIFAIERSVGWHGSMLIMRNPPLGLFLTLPLGTVRPRVGYLLWSLCVLGAWLGSIHLLWIMNGRYKNGLHLIGYVFAPAVACFVLGQTAMFVLLGLALFLYFHRSSPILAGAALVLCALKPHLFLPFGAVLLLWAVTRRAYRVLSSAAIALAICCVVPLFFDPSIYLQYLAMAHTSSVRAEFMPTLSELLRIAVNPNIFWLQFLPAFAGCLWAIWYFRRHRTIWDWRTHGPLLMLVSVVVAPYAWYFDGTVLLPSILYAAYRARPSALAVLFGLLAVAGVQLLLNTKPHSAWYLLSSPAWLAWYLWSMRRSPSSTSLPKRIEPLSPIPHAGI